jgi:nucleoside-diphosphate-sugar epimerase
MLKATVKAPLAVVRSTLIYGSGDPHNGYGPNRFRRLADAGQEIVLFGEGEERRDHVLVDDVAEIVCRVIERRSQGTLNIATGEVMSFRAIAGGHGDARGRRARNATPGRDAARRLPAVRHRGLPTCLPGFLLYAPGRGPGPAAHAGASDVTPTSSAPLKQDF